MSTEITTTLITAGGVVVVALIGFWTSRLTKKASDSSARVEERAKVIDGYGKLNEDLQEQNSKLTESVSKLSNKVEELSERIESCRSRINELETERDRNQRDFRTIVRYCKILIQIMRENNLEVPQQPLEILDYGA